MSSLKTLFISVLTVVVLLAITGCSNPEAAAGKLFDKGAYDEVIKKYPDTQFARRAHAKMGEDLLVKGDYEQVLKNYSDTPAAYQAKIAMANKLLEQGKYQEVIDKFPTLPAATNAKNHLADSLYAAGLKDEVLLKYPDAPVTMTIKNEKAQEILDAAKKLRGKARTEKLQDCVNRYKGSPAATEAQQILDSGPKPGAKK
jgi:hypothetical protein